MLPRIVVVLLVATTAFSAPLPKDKSDEPKPLTVQVQAPASDIAEAVAQVAQDQIIHGTYSYEKERILYGAHSSSTAQVFGPWQGQGQVYYKVASNILSPRFYKDSGDIGTIYVRYVVQEAAPNSTILQIESTFVDARKVKHPSLGTVESSEYAAILQHLKTIQAKRSAPEADPEKPAVQSPSPLLSGSKIAPPAGNAPTPNESVKDLEERVQTLRHQVELRVKDAGAPLKSAPYQSSATLETLPSNAEVLIVVLTPYWYGVQTTEGRSGWIHHSQLEPLP